MSRVMCRGGALVLLGLISLFPQGLLSQPRVPRPHTCPGDGPCPEGWRCQSDAAGRIVELTRCHDDACEDGRTWRYTYSEAGVCSRAESRYFSEGAECWIDVDLSYDALGRPMRRVDDCDGIGNGETYQWDEEGRLSIVEVDFDERLVRRDRFGYDAQGRVVEHVVWDDLDDRGAEADPTSRAEYEYDEGGRVAVETRRYGSIPQAYARREYRYDENGNRVARRFDRGADGNIDSICAFDPPCPPPFRCSGDCERQPDTTLGEPCECPPRDDNRVGYCTCDERGQRLRRELDDDGDGRPNLCMDDRYDAEGRTVVHLHDDYCDGFVDAVRGYFYGAHGLPVMEIYKASSGHGNITRFEYDAHGNQVVRYFDNHADEDVDTRIEQRYDARNRRVEMRIFRPGGHESPTRIESWTYDDADRELTWTIDRHGNGRYLQRYHYGYDAEGNRIFTAEDGESLRTADGWVDRYCTYDPPCPPPYSSDCPHRCSRPEGMATPAP